MKNKFKKFLAASLILALPYTGFEVYGNNGEKFTLEDKIECELDNETGVLDPEIEIKLNEEGVFDEEIEKLDDDTIDLLNDGNEFSVTINYYAISNEDYEEVDEKINNKEDLAECATQDLSETDINTLIDDVYGDEIKLHKKDKKNKKGINAKNKVYSVGQALGFAAEDVYAESDTTTTSGGKLKQVLIVLATSKKNGYGDALYQVNYYAQWLKNPSNRKIDVMGVSLHNASYDKDYSAQALYKAEEYYEAFFIGKYTTVREYPAVYNTDSGVAFRVNLWDNQTIQGLLQKRWYTNHYIQLVFYVTIDNKKSMRYFTATGYYWHQESTVEFKPSFSISSTGGVSVGGGVAVINKMSLMEVNPFVRYYFK